MGGTVDFESIKGEGSFFYIDLPVLDTKPVSEEQATSYSISASVRTSNKKMILLPRLTSIAIQY